MGNIIVISLIELISVSWYFILPERYVNQTIVLCLMIGGIGALIFLAIMDCAYSLKKILLIIK